MTVVELGHVSAILVSCSRSLVCQKLFIKSQCFFFFLRHCGMKICVVGGHNLFSNFFMCCGFRAVLIICVKIVCMCKLVKISTGDNSTVEPLPYMQTL